MKRIILLMLFILGAAVTVAAGSYTYIEPDQFRQWLETGKKMAVVDIQVPAEFREHHFRESLETNAYPVKTADDRKKLDAILPQLAGGGDDVVIVCPRGGGGAKNTFDYLKEKGISEKRLYILREGMQGWPYKELTVSGK